MKQVILVRRDLKMRRGKEIAQGAHASNACLTAALNKSKLDPEIETWLNSGSKKVCLQVHSEQELIDLYQKGIAANLLSFIIRDSGITEFDGVPTLTACAIGPAEGSEIDKITGHLKLY